MAKLPCHIEAPEWFLAPARYGLENLLFPLGITPVWQHLPSGSVPWLYYGADPAPRGSNGIVIPLDATTLEFFEQRLPRSMADVAWARNDGSTLPLLFGRSTEPAWTEAGSTVLQWDPVASTFYWLSGWHEVYTKQRDRHGRVPFEGSLPERLGVIADPPVDAYRELLAQSLRSIGVRAELRTWGGRRWAVCMTHDIDYDRKWRPGIVYRDFLGPQAGSPAARLGRLVRSLQSCVRQGDPYRHSALRLVKEQEKVGMRPTLFVKTVARGPYDVSYSIGSSWMRKLEQITLDASGTFALHTSYFGSSHEPQLLEEIERFENRFGHRPDLVRNHYLRLDPRRQAGLLADVGIGLDSSIAFAEQEGFRRGTCLPYRLFDHDRNRAAEVWEMPLSVMDSSLFTYRGLNAEGAIEATRRILDVCRVRRGACVLLFHNMAYDPELASWRWLFEAALDMAPLSDASTDTVPGALQSWLDDD